MNQSWFKVSDLFVPEMKMIYLLIDQWDFKEPTSDLYYQHWQLMSNSYQ